MQNVVRPQSWLTYFFQVIFTALVYFILARLSLLLQFDNSNATPVWPSAGFAFAIVLIWGARMAPGIFFGAFAANFMVFISNQTVDYPAAVTLSFIIAIGNTAEALLGKFFLKTFVPNYSFKTLLSKVDHVLRFAMTAALVCLVSSSVGTIAVFTSGIIHIDQFGPVWLTWWLGDFSGILLIASFILVWLNSFPSKRNLLRGDSGSASETILFFTVVFISGGILFDDWLLQISKWAYWIIPILVWGALRLTQRELITALVLYSLVAIWGTIHGRGPFSDMELNQALLSLQAFIAIMVVTKMTLNASVSERRFTEAMLRQTGDELEVRVKNRTAQLEERNIFVETILNSSFDSIMVLDTDLRCISINKVAKQNLMLPYPENVVGKKISELPSFILPEVVREDLINALNGETIHREKLASPVSDKYFKIDYIPLKNSDGVYALMIVAHDMTQRVHAEHEIREQKAFAELLIENSPYMIMACDKNMCITAWNRKSEEHSGISREQAMNAYIFKVFPQYSDGKWLDIYNDVLSTGRAFHVPKIQFLHTDGFGESFITPLFNSYNEIVGLLTITHDITELVNMTTALQQRNRDLLKTNEELSSFAYVASHDLQEPLRKIQIFSKMIIESEAHLSPNGKNYFERMRKAAERMQHLIEDLLTYSRTGSQERNFKTIHLSDIINEVKENLKDEITQKKATVIATDLCDCCVIPFQFHQLMHNLISNSLKFSKDGHPPVIEVKSTIKAAGEFDQPLPDKYEKYCHITVSDNGIGFEKTFNEQIFGLFQRLHGKSEYPGTGIGLAICKKIVENHDGVISAGGEPGKGAIFNIYIPHKIA